MSCRYTGTAAWIMTFCISPPSGPVQRRWAGQGAVCRGRPSAVIAERGWALLRNADQERRPFVDPGSDSTATVGRGALSLLVGRVGGVAGSLAAAQVITGLTYLVAARIVGPAILGSIATCVVV